MKIGLALGGGSLRGAAHIGVLKVLLENGIKPDIVAGTSAGSIVAGLYGAGFTPQQMEQWLNSLFRSAPELQRVAAKSMGTGPFRRTIKLPLGLVKVEMIETALRRYIGNKSFGDLTVPATVVTTDLHTGEGVVFASPMLKPRWQIPGFVFQSQAAVCDAIAGSIAIPGVFTPKRVGGRLLTDGGLVDNVPADVLKCLGADVVIAVDLGFMVHHEAPFNNLVEVLLQTWDVMGQRISNVILDRYADVVIRPATGPATLIDFKKMPGFVEAGVVATRKAMPEIVRVLRR